MAGRTFALGTTGIRFRSKLGTTWEQVEFIVPHEKLTGIVDAINILAH